MGGEEGGLEEEKERKIEEGGNDGRKGMVRGRDVERQTGRMGVLESEARDSVRATARAPPPLPRHTHSPPPRTD